MKRGVVVSNCQSQPLKHAISLYCENVGFDSFGVHILAPDRRDAEIEAFVARARTEYEVIIAIPLSADFGPLASDRIRETFADKLVVMIANIYFAGLHPDLTYIGGMASRIVGPLGDYHSKLALLCYLRGLSVQHAVAMYRDEVFEKLGYYDVYEASFEELRTREQEIDVPISMELESIVKRELAFFSVNHPTSVVVDAYAEKISNWLASHGPARMSGWGGGGMALVNHLASSSIFPVYPPVARRFGLEYAGSYAFKPATLADDTTGVLTLRQMVEGEYAAFDAFDKADLLASHQGQELAFRYGEIDLATL